MSTFSKVVTFEEDSFVGLICVDNPPVNALSHDVRSGLIDAMTQAEENPHIKVIVILSAGRLFSAGADIKEFDAPLIEPSLQKVEATIEASAVPVVAAIQGSALGGGLELAMACHYRVAHTSARLGLPEITLGLIPGAGGTQRLPRLIGSRAALDMILSGTPIAASDAKAKELVDEVVEGDLREAALDFCRRLVHDGVGPRPTCSRSAPSEALDEAAIAEALQTHARALEGRTTQNLVVAAIKASRLPFSEGIAVEQALARQSLASEESRVLRNIFFAERKSRKPMFTNRKTIRIEWGDCDPAGIVYFPRYFEFFDACTVALFERVGFFKRDMLNRYGIAGIPIVDMKAQFLMPSRFGDDVVVESSVTKWGKSSFVVRHRLMKGDALAIECFETRVWTAHPDGDPEKFEARAIPEEVKKKFSTDAESKREE